MMRDYQQQTARLRAMQGARAIVTASEHMRLELLKNGLARSACTRLGCRWWIRRSRIRVARGYDDLADESNGGPKEQRTPRRVVFIGRLEKPKGGLILIDAMRAAAAALKRRLSLTLVGDGRERDALESKARSLMGNDQGVEISFTGWLEREAISAVIDQSDLLAVPSLWPEPFGLVGVEAGMRGLPAVAFEIGGITEWLEDGVNGRAGAGQSAEGARFGRGLGQMPQR